MRGESYGNICRDCRQDRSSERASGDLCKANADGLKIRGNDAVYPYVDPDKITTIFLFATSPLLSQSGNTKSSIKGNTLNSDSLNRKSPCSSGLYKRRHCLPSVTAQTRLLLFNKCLWLHKQKIKSHHSSTRSAIILASLTASAS